MRRGFTLIEILITIAIVAVLASVVFASLNAARERSRITSARSFAAQVDRVEGDQAALLLDFNECSGTTAVDASGFNHSATLSGSPTWSTDTPSGTGCSLSFNGTTGQWALSNNVQAQLTSGKITISVWVKSASPTWNTYGWIVSSRTGNAVYILHPTQGSKALTFYVGDGVTTPGLNATVQGEITDWHQYTGVYDGTTAYMYIDGILRAKAVHNITFNPGTAGTYIGSDGTLVPRVGTGLIDNVHIYSKEFTAMEVQRQYALERGLRDLAQK